MSKFADVALEVLSLKNQAPEVSDSTPPKTKP